MNDIKTLAGLCQGSPDLIPVAESDFIFSAIAEELGVIFALCVILICVSCYVMFLNIAMQLHNMFYKMVALGLGTCYIFQVFLNIGGVTKFIPSTGVTLPLVSYGGSSILSSMIMIGIIQGLYIIREDEEEELEQEDTKQPEFRTGRILLAEDNELNQEIAEAILGDAGFEVEIAENGQIAVDMLNKVEPGYYQLVLMDVQMPVMNGYEATREVRSLDNPEIANIPILAMTANAFEEDKQAALRCGMNGHIAKPIDIDNLFGTLRQILK